MLIERLESPRIPEAAAMLRRAFDADPMFRFLLPGERARRTWLRLLMASALAECANRGEIWAAHLEGLAGAIGIVPPGHVHASTGSRIATLMRLLGTTPAIPPPLRFLVHGPRVLQVLARHHPRERHLYVQVLGADPAMHGRGVGAALIEKALARAAEEGAFAYLETTNERNLGFYGRFGFRVVDEMSPSPGGGPPIWFLRT